MSSGWLEKKVKEADAMIGFSFFPNARTFPQTNEDDDRKIFDDITPFFLLTADVLQVSSERIWGSHQVLPSADGDDKHLIT